MFVCHRCGHRAESLPLRLPGTKDTICSFPFTQPNACAAGQENHSRDRILRRFRHPRLSYGIVYTAFRAFQVQRGIVAAPEEVGTRCAWALVDDDDESRPTTVHKEHATLSNRAH
jgi:hypothetical protein